MSMQWRAFCSSAALLAGLCVASQSFAADLDMISYEPGAPVQQPVEVGSGWYLRGDIGYNLLQGQGSDRDIFLERIAKL